MVSVIGLLLAFVGFFLSPIGLFAFFVGILMFITLPIIPALTNHFHSFARFHLFLASRLLKRAAFVVSEHGDLLLKRMSPDDIGTERIAFEDDIKEFEDPTNALHWWNGIPFALADEVHGVLFDPRHAAVGKRKWDVRKAGSHVIQATKKEMEEYEVVRWAHAVYEFPRNTYEIVDLGKIRELSFGSERAEYPARVKTFYENSRAPYLSGSSTARWILIIVAAIAPFAAMWLIADQLMSSSSSTIGFGLLVLLLSTKGVNPLAILKRVLIWSAVLLPLPLIFVFLWVVVNPLFAVLVFVTLGMGFWLIPIVFMLLRVSTGFADWASGLLFRLGMLGYDRPIFEWTPTQYRFRELSKLDNVDESDAAWYGLAGNLVGFTFTPGEQSWSTGVVNKDELKSDIDEPGTEAGRKTNIPTEKYRIWTSTVRSVVGSIIPKDLDTDTNYYLGVGVTLENWAQAARGEKSTQRLTQAKDEAGEESHDETRFGLMIAMVSLISFATGVFVFFL